MSDTKKLPTWVIMVYLAADDTLANFAIESLKQLKMTATDDVVVAAQLDPDGLSAEHQVRRYIFNESTRNEPLLDDNKFWKTPDHRSLNMTDPRTLSNFINWVYQDYKAEKYCLILWGHGPELLFELPARSDRQVLPSGPGSLSAPAQQNGAQAAGSAGNAKTLGDYLSPAQLREALDNTDPVEKEKLEIIAIDACSMSMCELAYELQKSARFLVASQEEVPDLSFPYHNLVWLFSKNLEPRQLCQDGIGGYVRAYQEYFYSESTGMHPVTLATIELGKMAQLKNPLKELAYALLSAATDNEAAQAIRSARSAAQGYVGGLYVDLHDFCDQLAGLSSMFQSVCARVSAAIDKAVAARAGVVDGRTVEIVGQRVSVDSRVEKLNSPRLLSYGLSIYFPYLRDGQEKEFMEQDLAKGIPRLIDKDSEALAGLRALNALSNRLRYAVRRQMIQDIEDHYQDPPAAFEGDTGWLQFIQQGWSRILANQEPDNVDTHYLAQQAVKNLFGVIQNVEGKIGVAASKKRPQQLSPSNSPRKAKAHA